MASTKDQIQGRDTQLILFLNGKPQKGLTVKNFDWEAIQDFKERDLLGEARTQFSHQVNGYKGTFDVDVATEIDHEIAIFLNDADKSGVPNYQVAVQTVENYRNGSRRKLRFVDVVLGIPKTSNQGRKDDLKRTYEWRASDMIKVK
ncbi:hypothetical protein GC173_11580 [bacterium]|nr:hypothetical protein [bacterium]